MPYNGQRLELPFPVLFPLCLAILEEARMPLQYRDLTLRAMQRLGILSADHATFPEAVRKNEENVREKFLKNRWKGQTFYLGNPYCLGGLRRWFHLPQSQLFHLDEVRIPGHAQAGVTGAFQALMRFPYLQQKNPYASASVRMQACAAGFVLEAHITHFFLEHYPTLFVLPDNAHDHRQWDKNDVYLVVKGQRFGVDIFGPTRTGRFTRAPGKPLTDIHIAASIDQDACVLRGVTRGQDLPHEFFPQTSWSPINFLVWLNCLRAGLPYKLLAMAAV
jgi:hypothetical protein